MPISTPEQEAGVSVVLKRGHQDLDSGLLFWAYEHGRARWVSSARFRQLKSRTVEVSRKYREAHPDRVRGFSERYSKANRQKRRDACRRWRERDPDRARRIRRAWTEKNRAKVDEKNREWNKANVARRAAVRAAWKKENAAKISRQSAEWAAKNKGKRNAAWMARKALKENSAKLTGAKPSFMLQFYLTAERISACLSIPFHVDHIRPLAKGGAHNENNLQVIPARINLRKSAKWSGV